MNNGKESNQGQPLTGGEDDLAGLPQGEGQRLDSDSVLLKGAPATTLQIERNRVTGSLVQETDTKPIIHLTNPTESTARNSEPPGIGLFRPKGISTGLEEQAWIRYAYHEVIRGSYTAMAEIGKYNQLGVAPSDTPLWRSYFAFDGKIIPYLKQNRRVQKQYPDKVGINEIVIDLDTKEGVTFDDVLIEARKLVQYITSYHDIPLNYIQVFFSGSKGFHVHLPNLFGFTESTSLPDMVHATLEEEFGFCKSMDLSMIRTNGLIRVPYSKHQSTGLYKQPLHWNIFFYGTPEGIREYSRKPIFQAWNLPDEIETPLSRLKCVPKVKPRGVYVDTTNTTERVTCMQKLYNRGAIDGRGHSDSLRLASWLKRMGMPIAAALHVLKGWYNFVDTDDQEKVVESVYTKSYVYSCDDVVMKEFCDEKCIFFNQGWTDESNTNMVNNADDLLTNLKEYKKMLDSAGWIDLQDVWPAMKESYRIYPGEVAMFTGDTGMGKSALVQKILVSISLKVLYLNLEMNESLAARRLLQVGHGMTKWEVIKSIGRMSDDELKRPIQHIEMVSIAPKHTEVVREVRSRKPDLLVIDTSDAIEVDGSGNNEIYQLKMVIEMMRRLAQQQQMIVIAVHHINKDASKKGFIDLNSLQGSRNAVTKVDHVFAVTGVKTSPLRKLRTLKARDEDPFSHDLSFDFLRMQMIDIDNGAPLFDENEESESDITT